METPHTAPYLPLSPPTSVPQHLFPPSSPPPKPWSIFCIGNIKWRPQERKTLGLKWLRKRTALHCGARAPSGAARTPGGAMLQHKQTPARPHENIPTAQKPTPNTAGATWFSPKLSWLPLLLTPFKYTTFPHRITCTILRERHF